MTKTTSEIMDEAVERGWSNYTTICVLLDFISSQCGPDGVAALDSYIKARVEEEEAQCSCLGIIS